MLLILKWVVNGLENETIFERSVTFFLLLLRDNVEHRALFETHAEQKYEQTYPSQNSLRKLIVYLLVYSLDSYVLVWRPNFSWF